MAKAQVQRAPSKQTGRPLQLKGLAAVVTGAASGIGRAIAQRFAQEGARVVVADIDESGGRQTAAQLADRAVFVKTDVRQEDDIHRLVDAATQRWGKLDAVIHSAGIFSPKEMDLTTLPVEEFTRVMQTNFASAFLLTKYGVPHLLRSRGTLIHIASCFGLDPSAELPIYSASKAAIIALTKSTALRVAKHGVRVNCICPGPIDTPMLRSAFPDEGSFRAYLAEHPMGRAGTPEEVANVAVFLASSQSTYVTGSVYVVDGGALLG